jgi:phosphatidylinositol 3-kinase
MFNQGLVSGNNSYELYISCALYSRGLNNGLTLQSKYTNVIGTVSSDSSCVWNEWKTFPVKYRDLSPTARLCFTIYAAKLNSSPAQLKSNSTKDGTNNPFFSTTPIIIVGGSSFPLFTKRGVLKLGKRKLFLHANTVADTALNSSTPHMKPGLNNPTNPLDGLLSSSLNPSLENLDRRIRDFDRSFATSPNIQWLDKLALKKIEKMQQNNYYNSINTLQLTGYNSSPSNSSTIQLLGSVSNISSMYLCIEFPNFPHSVVYHQKTCNYSPYNELSSFNDSNRVFVLNDSEMSKENPVENKYHKLARSERGLADKHLIPKIIERKQLQSIITSPNKKLTMEQKELLWKFRFSLVEDKRALTKFLRCVNWSDVLETRQAIELMGQWAAVDLADALELLCDYFTNSDVRIYAVQQLQKADNEEIFQYLLQLVQALRYEEQYPNHLSRFLVERALKSFQLSNFFYWYVAVEVSDQRKGPMFAALQSDFINELVATPHGRKWQQGLLLEGQLINSLIELGDSAKSRDKKVDKKIQRMKQLLGQDGDYRALRSFEPVHLAVRPEVLVTGLIGEKCTMFKSALAPLLCCFTTVKEGQISNSSSSSSPPPEPGPEYRVIFKRGDDLRQDQLIIQMINLMDSLLKKVKLDLQLTPYRVLATGPADGFVEFVPDSYTLTSILDSSNHGSIQNFFQFHNNSPQALNKVLDNFTKSSAGYCVITYILGIGDRHLDNVLLTKRGHLFHIDFGFIFGRDPKPFPPPMKFSKEMVEAMGGAQSPPYMEFRRYCVLAFNILRQHAVLIINLLSLMAHANIPDLSQDVEKNLLKVQDKFRLDLTDEEAGHYILSLIDQSVSALFPVMMEKIHKWALYWK